MPYFCVEVQYSTATSESSKRYPRIWAENEDAAIDEAVRLTRKCRGMLSVVGGDVLQLPDDWCNTLSSLLHGTNRKLLDVLPAEPADILDLFVVHFLEQLARDNLGSGFDAIDASVKLEVLRTLSYAEMRDAAVSSPDFEAFVAAKNAELILEAQAVAETSSLRTDAPDDLLEGLLFEDPKDRPRNELEQRYNAARCIALCTSLGDSLSRAKVKRLMSLAAYPF